MNMKAILAGAAMISLGLFGPADAKTVLRFSSFEPAVAFITKNILTEWAKNVSEASNETLEIQMFPGGTLGRNPAQQLKLVEDGVADIAWAVAGYTPGVFPSMSVTELPFLVTSSTAGSVASWRMVEKGFFKQDTGKIRILGIFTSAQGAIVSKTPIKVPEDMKGMRFRSAGPYGLALLEALDAVPVGGITGPTIAESISRGLINGTFSEWNAMETFRIFEAVNHFLLVPMGSVSLLVIMNKDKYDSLPQEAKDAIDRYSGEAFSRVFGNAYDGNSARVRDIAYKEAANTIVEPDAELREQWHKAALPVIEKWIAENENGKEIYETFAAEIKKVEAGD